MSEPRSKLRKRIEAGVLAALIVLVVGGLHINERLSAPREPGVLADVFEVPAGSGSRQVAQELFSRGLIRDPAAFRLLLRFKDADRKLRAGEFLLSPSMSASQVLDALISGPIFLHEITVPEGFSARQIAARLAAQGLGKEQRYLELMFSEEFARSLDVSAASLEGYLFPTTYKLAKPVKEEYALRKMVTTLREHLPEDLDAQLERLPHIANLHELLTLASIVEKETGAPEERPLIARVFYNRLEKGMRLETDPTVIYGMGEKYRGNIRKSDLLTPTPYNTYKIAGLPPGPIASPGQAAIEACLHPAQGDYLFFVARQDGTHYFSETYARHQQAVRHYQLGKGKPPPKQ